MAERNFMELLKARWLSGNFVCVGLDSELGKVPACIKTESVAVTILAFNQRIVEACFPFSCAFKPNLAFYLSYGESGLVALKQTVEYINFSCPEVPVILDAKWADIGNTNLGYVEMAFEYVGADAVTVHPYLGREALKPFLDLPDKGVIVLCRTSNPGAGEFQDLESKGAKLYRLVARSVADNWNKNGNCAVVAGATYPGELAEIRQVVGKMPILIPGIGAQGGDVEATVRAGQDSNGSGMIINSSRGIIFASKGEDFAERAGEEAKKLRDEINKFRKCS
jgi:orotidine-5'-phosphate decarboxylase